jgi:hypothetical protein
MAGTLTVANSTLAMTVEALFPQSQRIQGYSADDAFDFESVENGEYSMGIDGKLSAGFVYNEIPFTITLQADSASLSLFEQTYLYEVSNRTKLGVDVTLTLPAVSKRYDLTGGFQRRFKAPSGKKILQPGVVEFVFARLAVSPL